MGLGFGVKKIDYDECAASWGYPGFNNFRKRLALAVGIDLDLMPGFAKEPEFEWDDFDDDIIPLLNHSDCDGDLTPEECKTVAPRLRELVLPWDANHDRDRVEALYLADTMEKCAEKGWDLIFC